MGQGVISKRKESLVSGHSLSLTGGAGGLRTITSSSFGEGREPTLITSLVLLRKFLTDQLRFTLLGEVETSLRSGVRPKSGDLAQVMPF